MSTTNARLVVDHFHTIYPGFVIFFRISNNYVAFFEDAEESAKALGADLVSGDIPVFSLNASDVLDSIEHLSMSGVNAITVTYTNKNGEHCLPEIEEF